ncbi:hypothetical protein SRHO_G00217170 [Serrasalmus rhombeus]
MKHTPLLPTNTYTSFEYHATLVNTPAKLGIVIYRPPGQMGEFTNELDMLLSSIPDQDCPMLILGDMNIHLDSPCSTDFISLMHSFDLEQVPSPPTHKAGKNLDLIFTCNCDTDSLTVTPLHLSDHYFIQLNVCIEKKPKAAPTMVSFRRNLRDLSADQYSSLVTDNMPPPDSFSSLNVNDATDTLCSTLSSCLDDLCPLTTRVMRSNKPQPWLKNDTVRELRSRLRAAERKWREKRIHADLKNYQLLLASFSTCLTTAKAEFYHSKINSLTDSRKLFATFNTLLNPPPPATCLTADALASFFTGKVAAISSQFTDATCSCPTTCSAPLYPSTKGAIFSSFTPLTESEALTLVTCSRPTTCPLDPIPTDLLQTIAPAIIPAITHTINASITIGVFPTVFKQAQVTPLLKKPSHNPAQVFAACAAGFHCTGFEINSMLLAYSRGRAWWRGLPHSKATFVNQDFWKTDLSKYTNVIAFLAPAVMQDLEEKLLKELPGDARVVVCRFPFPHWPHSCTTGTGLDQVWAYDVYTVQHRANISSLKPQG